MLLLALLSVAELLQQGSSLFQKGQFAEAAAVFEQASKQAPRDPVVWKALGASFAAQEDYERAVEPFERACTLDSKLADACYYYARSLYALNRFVPALEALKKAPDSWRVQLGIGQASEALGRAAEAEAAFRKSIAGYERAQDRGRPDFDPRLHYAVFLFRQARLPESLTQARAVTSAWPAFGRGHFEAGRVLQHQGELEEAARELELAVRGGYGAPAHLLLGRVYLRLGKKAEADKHLALGR